MDPVNAENVLVYLIGKHSLLSPEDAGKIAQGIVEDLGLTTEEATPKGLEYLSSPTIARLVSTWRRV